MANITVTQDTESLLLCWLELEKKGEQFPVPFDLAWAIAGYSRKDSAKRKLNSDYFTEHEDFHIAVERTQHKDSSAYSEMEVIYLTCDAFKEFCMLSKTKMGKDARRYFIEAEKRWKIVQQQFPEVAAQTEAIALSETLKLRKEVVMLEKALLDKREYIATALPRPIGDRILGITTISEPEYRDRIIKDGQILNDGSTVNKTTLCHRYGILTKNGKPDYKKLNQHLGKMPSESFKEASVIQENQELKRDFLPILDKLIEQNERQMWIGE